jgi:hypothetical protein
MKKVTNNNKKRSTEAYINRSSNSSFTNAWSSSSLLGHTQVIVMSALDEGVQVFFGGGGGGETESTWYVATTCLTIPDSNDT